MGTSEGVKKGWTDESRQKRSEAMKLKWQDPEYRAAHHAARHGTGPKKTDEQKKQREEDAARRPGKNKWLPEKREAFSQRQRERGISETTRARISAAGKRRWALPGAGTAQSEKLKSWYAKPENLQSHIESMRKPSTRAKTSAAAKRDWAKLTPEERRLRTAKMRNKIKGGHHITVIEAAVVMTLNELGVWYQLHQIVDGYTADILCYPNIIIECDGGWYHDQRRDTDEIRDTNLLNAGYQTIRLSASSIGDESYIPVLRQALT
jgi:very-short-patch-repair endonuclease